MAYKNRKTKNLTVISSFKKNLKFIFAVFALSFASLAYSSEVAFAGFAYSGDHESIGSRFPYSKRFEVALGTSGVNGLLQNALTKTQPQAFTIVPRLDELIGKDQAIAVSLVMTNEVVSVEKLGNVYKLFVQLRGQALFFDFKTKTVLRAYPFSFAYLDAAQAEPTDMQKDAAISQVYLGANGKSGIIDRFTNTLISASIPTSVPRFVQVTSAVIDAEARSQFPASYGHGVAETWVADTFGEAIANTMGIPILPFSKGYAIGNVMSMTVSDGSVFNLKLPQPDYEFVVNLSQLKKVTYNETAAGKSLIYGAFASVKLIEPLSGHVYLDGQYKNGEIKVVSAIQENTEDFPAFQDSIRGLFTKLAGVIAGDNNPWLKSATSGKDTNKQIASTRELLKTCK